MLDVLDVMTRLGEVKNKTAAALRATEADTGASVVTVAVVREFDKKADKANRQPEGDGSARDSVIEATPLLRFLPSAGFAGAILPWGRPRRGPSRPPPTA